MQQPGPTLIDVTCGHGTAMDVHCCYCHSGFIFDTTHECPPPPVRHVATCETNGHVYGHTGACVFCNAPKPVDSIPAELQNPLLSDHESDAAEFVRWRGLIDAVRVVGGFPEGWPEHGNAPLAIAASYTLQQREIERLREERDEINNELARERRDNDRMRELLPKSTPVEPAGASEPVAKMLRAHADAVFRMPTGEQFMGARDASFHSAMLQLADWIDSVEQRLRKDTPR